ncbi:MAG: TetR/AcrR family transcriptional regulator [Bacteroidia bacterium]|jgi:AcrR family transcriptional regulator|uniref:HTH tetR-type domain-containing protein n=1 Tax=bioreactor metagenome TaxID=1076179 RepID=A0A644YYZ4_9ZZZZ|nr:TetR/AcrR family transcriptional regulator [Rikenellaceae bacterium]NCB18453.1 TetR/AcrR family transcriptional regulator [Bacteroidia bacterium]
MARVSSKERYVTKVYELFRKKGLKLTMDDIAVELKLTKKTLYNNFKSKEVLMRTVMQFVIEDIEFKINLSLSQGKNAIEALFHSSSMMNKTLEELGPQLLSDSSKYLPDLKVLDHTNRMSFYSRIISENLERGVLEGLYRSDINKELATLFFTSAMAKIYSWNGSYVFLRDPFLFHSELVRYHLEAVVNDSGREILRSFIQK